MEEELKCRGREGGRMGGKREGKGLELGEEVKNKKKV